MAHANLPHDGMDFTPFDTLTAEELDDLVENIESLAGGAGFDDGAIGSDTLAESAVTFSKLLGTIFSGELQTASNAGTAGGTNWWVNLGGIKVLWGISPTQAMGTYTVTFPDDFFSDIQIPATGIGRMSGNTNLIVYQNAAVTTSTLSYQTVQNASSGASASVWWIVIGS